MEKRNTIQKKLVLDAVSRLATHPTAEEVYLEVTVNHPTVSKATVYRNLTGLSKDGRLRHIRMPGGADRFDHTLISHFHIECTECGVVCDAMIEQDTHMDEYAEQNTGFTNVNHDIVFHGICPACQNKN